MGYYDQDESSTRKERKRGLGSGISAFIGAIIGGLIVLFLLPILGQFGLSPYELANEDSEETGELVIEENRTEGIEQMVNVSVDSNVIDVVEKVSDAVVGVISMQNAGLFSQSMSEGTGSGVIYKKANGKAFIVTNFHVIDGARQIDVSLADGTRVGAELIGTDILTDLAVLQIDDEAVTTVAEFGNSETLRPGEPAIAIGNPLGLRFSSSVTQGIISAVERSIPVDLNGDGQIDWQAEVIQTDAAINPGNSGGALLNIQGQVIGINSMKIAQSSVEGIGFAIPTAIAAPVINDLERFGEVKRPQMGIGIHSLSEVQSYHWQETLKLPEEVKAGVVVTSVTPMSPAAQAGLQEYDVIVEINGEAVESGHDLRKYLYSKTKIGDQIEVSFYREGNKQTVTVQLTEQQSF